MNNNGFRKNMETILLISLGAVLGANLRYWLGMWAARQFGTEYPLGTMLINLTGSLVIGLFITLISNRFMVDPRWRIFFAVGFLGSYTTFSTYTFESITLLQAGRWAAGLWNLFGGAMLGGIATLLGVWLARYV